MKDKFKKLIDVKSIVTILLTATFIYITVKCFITADQFMNIFTMIISFYFCTQVFKNNGDNNNGQVC